MSRNRLLGRSVTLGCLTALAVPVAAQAENRDFYGVDDRNNLVKFDRKSPDDLKNRESITGLPMGEELVGIDFRPKTGDLYGLGSDSNIYRVNPRTGIAIAESGTPFTPELEGDSFGVDFNPVPDRLRVTSDADQSLRCDVDANTCVQDGDLNRGNEDPHVVGSAYRASSFSFQQPAVTELYAADSRTDALYEQDPPNDGTLIDETPVDFNIRSRAGFDIAGTNDAGFITSANKKKTKFYRVDVDSGESKELGRVGNGIVLTGLAAVQDEQ